MEWLKAIREERGLSQAALTEKIGMTQGGYSNIERGKRMPGVYTAKRIGECLGFRWTKFYGEEDERA